MQHWDRHRVTTVDALQKGGGREGVRGHRHTAALQSSLENAGNRFTGSEDLGVVALALPSARLVLLFPFS